MHFNVSLGLKESGGWALSPWEKPASIIRGQHCKLGVVICDSSGRPLTLTNYTTKLRLRQANNAVLVKTAISVDNNKGEVEFVLEPDETAILEVGPNQTLEVECYLTATPTTNSIHKVSQCLTVVMPIFVP